MNFVDFRTARTLLNAGAQFSFDDIANLRHIQFGYSNETEDEHSAREEVLAKFKIWARTLGEEELSRLHSWDRLNLENLLAGRESLYLSPHSSWGRDSDDPSLDSDSETTCTLVGETKDQDSTSNSKLRIQNLSDTARTSGSPLYDRTTTKKDRGYDRLLKIQRQVTGIRDIRCRF